MIKNTAKVSKAKATKNGDKVSTTLRLPKELHKALKIKGIEQEKSIEEISREAFSLYLLLVNDKQIQKKIKAAGGLYEAVMTAIKVSEREEANSEALITMIKNRKLI